MEVNIILVQEQLDFYRKNAYLAVGDVFTTEEMEELCQVTDEFVEKSREVRGNTSVFDLEPGHTPEHPRLRRLKDPVKLHPAYDGRYEMQTYSIS